MHAGHLGGVSYTLASVSSHVFEYFAHVAPASNCDSDPGLMLSGSSLNPLGTWKSVLKPCSVNPLCCDCAWPWEESGEPGENPRRNGKKTETPHRNAQVGIELATFLWRGNGAEYPEQQSCSAQPIPFLAFTVCFLGWFALLQLIEAQLRKADLQPSELLKRLSTWNTTTGRWCRGKTTTKVVDSKSSATCSEELFSTVTIHKKGKRNHRSL